MRRCVCAIALLVASACGGAKGRGAGGGGGGDLGCLPAAGASSFRLVNVDGRTHVCSERSVADGGAAHHACWLVDLGSGAVRPSDVVVEPGRGRVVPAAWTADGLCAHGYCVPVSGTDGASDEAEPTVQLAVGEGIAVMLTGGVGPNDGFALFDQDKRLKPPPAGADRNDGPSASASDPLIVGDVIFVGDFDAGPHADVHVYSADGVFLGPVTDPDDEEEYSGDFELWNGSVSVLSDYEVAFAEHLLQRVLVFHTREKKVTQVWRRQSAVPETCTAEMRGVYFDAVEVNLEFALEEGRMGIACKQDLDAVDGRFGPYGLARNSDGALVALARTGDALVLVTFDRDGDIVKDVPIEVCGAGAGR